MRKRTSRKDQGCTHCRGITLTRRAALHALVLGLLLASSVGSGRAQSTESELAPVVAEAASHYGISAAWMSRIVTCESRWDVYAIGAAGELGLVQLHPRGLLSLFRRVGYTDPFDPSQAIWFLGWALSQGMASHWSCSR